MPEQKSDEFFLDSEHEKRLGRHIRDKWKNGCPFCGNTNWTAHGFVNLEVSPKARASVWGAQVLPGAALVCTECGFTAIVNLIAAGIFTPETVPE